MVSRVAGAAEGQMQRLDPHLSSGSSPLRVPSIAKDILGAEARISQSTSSCSLAPSQLENIPSEKPEDFFDIGPNQWIFPFNSDLSARVATYETGTLLGEGSQAKVFEGIDCATGRKVALKCSRSRYSDQKFYMIQISEELLLRKLSHCPYVPRVLDAFDLSPGERVLVMEKLGDNLFNTFGNPEHSSYKPLTMVHILNIAREGLLALDFFKKEKIAHSDLKPENLIFDPESMRLKVVDFGCAYGKLPIPKDTEAQTIWYRSPEITLRIGGTEAVDMWSLGFIIAELVAGEEIINTRKELNTPLLTDEEEDLHMRNIVNLLGMPPDEWLMRSPKKSCKKSSIKPLFKKMEDGQYYLIEKGAKPGRPINHFVSHITGIFKKQWPNHREEIHHLADLIGKMTTYEGRITPEKALQHPLFIKKNIFWQIVKTGTPNQFHSITIAEENEESDDVILEKDPRYPCFPSISVNLDQEFQDRWFLPNPRSDARYAVKYHMRDGTELNHHRVRFPKTARIIISDDQIKFTDFSIEGSSLIALPVVRRAPASSSSAAVAPPSFSSSTGSKDVSALLSYHPAAIATATSSSSSSLVRAMTIAALPSEARRAMASATPSVPTRKRPSAVVEEDADQSYARSEEGAGLESTKRSKKILGHD